MSIFTDTFTDTAGTLLSAHTVTGGSGGPWAKHTDISGGTGTLTVDSAGTGLISSANLTTNQALYLPSGLTPPSADYEVVIGWRCRSVVAQATTYGVVRIGTGAGQRDGYALRGTVAADGGTTWQLYKLDTAASGTLVGSYAEPAPGGWTVGQIRQATLRAVGSVISMVLDGTTRITYTDATPVTRVGKPGVFGTSSQSQSTGYHFASVTVNDLTPSAPANSVVPAITGTAAVGATLTRTRGTYSGFPTSYTDQWQRRLTGSGNAFADITGATGGTYVPVTGDAAYDVRYSESAHNAAGDSATVYSNTIAIPAAPTNTLAPTITTDGSPQTGEVITGGDGTWANATSFEYQWVRGAGFSPISGETAHDHQIDVSEEGIALRFGVRATGPGGVSAWAYSDPVTPAVTAPLSNANGVWFYSGGSSNTDPAASIGGVRGGTIPAATVSSVFGAIPGSVAQAGGVFYAVLYIRNTHTATTDPATRLLVADQPDNTGLHIDVAVPTEGVNTAVTALASTTTAPSGKTFSRPATFADGLTFGDLGPTQYRGVYVRLTVDPGTTPTISDSFTLRVRSETA